LACLERTAPCPTDQADTTHGDDDRWSNTDIVLAVHGEVAEAVDGNHSSAPQRAVGRVRREGAVSGGVRPQRLARQHGRIGRHPIPRRSEDGHPPARPRPTTKPQATHQHTADHRNPQANPATATEPTHSDPQLAAHLRPMLTELT
jgi:hypothetical protein